nr:hypothetical protein HUO10_005836 [Paraburkholderia busanensis]
MPCIGFLFAVRCVQTNVIFSVDNPSGKFS